MLDLNTGKEIKIDKKVKSQVIGGEIVSSLVRLDKIEYILPLKIESVLRGLSLKYRDVEFSIFAKTYFDSKNNFYISDPDDIFIPKQTVSRAHIKYEEDNLEYNTVFHKHPDGCKRFSGTDKNYINSNFKFSILWVDDNFSEAIVNLKLEDGVFVEIPLSVRREHTIPTFPAIAEEKIKKEIPVCLDTNASFFNFQKNWKDQHEFFKPSNSATFQKQKNIQNAIKSEIEDEDDDNFPHNMFF